MMEKLKRHMFLLVLVAGVLAVLLAVFLTAYFLYTRSAAQTRQTLDQARRGAEALLPKKENEKEKLSLYTPELVTQMAKQVDLCKKEYEDIINYIRDLGKARPPIVKDLFPVSADTGLRHAFKAEYDAALVKLSKSLNAIAIPTEKGPDAERAAMSDEAPPGFIYVHPKTAFFRPDWVDKPEAPSLEQVRYGQEDLWLMQDLVDLVKKMNEDLRPALNKEEEARAQGSRSQAKPPDGLKNSAIKELLEIRVGGEYATLANAKMTAINTRYVTAATTSAGGAKGRVPTVQGLASDPGFYLVLPFRMTVVVESRYSGELLRRIKGTESFLSVDACQMKPIPGTFGQSEALSARKREVYGPDGVVRMAIVGESLVFQLEGGRVTTPPAATAAAPTPTK